MKHTQKIILTFFVLFFTFGAMVQAQYESKIDKLFSTNLEHALISRGDNFPNFRIAQDSLDYLLLAIHQNIPLAEFGEKTKFNDAKIKKILSFLESKNWASVIEEQYKPTVFIADAQDGEQLYKYASPISQDITKAIDKILPHIKEQFLETEMSNNSDFEKWAFFILSDVLLDSWQIDYVERDFLKQADRPLRHGKNYYSAILEKSDKDQESFGIYGNQQSKTEDSSIFGIYGNNRPQRSKKEDYTNNIITPKDNVALEQMAVSFLPSLLLVLEKYRTYSEQVYRDMGYSSAISFDEFYIWFYHFIYTQTTNQLAERQIIKIPNDGNFYYCILP